MNDFVNLSFETRFRQGVRLGGGIDTGRTVDDACLVVDSPQQLLNCRVVQPMKSKTELKLSGSYPLPAGFVVSAVYQNLPGVPLTADYAATTAEIAPSLGRPLAGGARQANVPLIEPYTRFEDRITRLDLRFTKFFDVGRFRVQGNLDIYNVANTGDILATTNTYGSRWRLPISIIEGRTVQFGGQVSF